MKVTQEQFKTTKDQLVVLVPDLKKETDGGIQIPDSVLEQRAKDRGLDGFAEVIKVGADVKEVSVGDKVLLRRLEEVPVEGGEGFKVAVGRQYDVVGFYSTQEDFFKPDFTQTLEDKVFGDGAIPVGTTQYKDALTGDK